MQSRLAIAALIGAVSAKDLNDIQHVIVQAAGKDVTKGISHGIQDLKGALTKRIHGAEHSLEHAEEVLEELVEAADELLEQDKKVEQTELSAVDIKKLEGIVGGILKGALDAEGFSDINTCIADAEHIFADAEDAIKDFESKDTAKIIDGVKKIADILQTVQKGMSDCSQLKADWAKLEKMAAIFSSPTAFAYHVGKDLMINGVDIFHEIEDAIQQYADKNWEQFGVDVGEAAAKTILGAESAIQLGATPEQVKLAQIEQGLIKAFGGKIDILALLSCIGEEDKALLIFDAAYQQLEAAISEKNAGDAVAAVIMVVAGIKQAQQGWPACEAIDKSTFKYDQMMSSYEIAAHPTQYFDILEKDLLLHGNSIKKDLWKAVKSYQKEQYDSFGFYLGSVLELATRPAETETAPVEMKEEEVFTRAMATEIVQGFFEATKVGTFNFTNLLLCIYEADQAALIGYEAVQLLEEAYKDKDPMEAVGGIIAIIAFIQGIKQQALPVCEAVDQSSFNWGTFDHIVEIAESPEKHMRIIGEDVIFNGATITADVADALDAFRSEDYKTFGYKLGDAMTLATEDNLTLY